MFCATGNPGAKSYWFPYHCEMNSPYYLNSDYIYA